MKYRLSNGIHKRYHYTFTIKKNAFVVCEIPKYQTMATARESNFNRYERVVEKPESPDESKAHRDHQVSRRAQTVF